MACSGLVGVYWFITPPTEAESKMAPECGVPPEGIPEGHSDGGIVEEVFGKPQEIEEAMRERADRIRGIVEEGPPADSPEGAEEQRERSTQTIADAMRGGLKPEYPFEGEDPGPPPGAPVVASGTGQGAPVVSLVDQDRQRLHGRICVDFTHHPPVDDQVRIYNHIRAMAREFAHQLVDNVPPGRELSRALSDLEDCVMHANAGIARRSDLYTR